MPFGRAALSSLLCSFAFGVLAQITPPLDSKSFVDAESVELGPAPIADRELLQQFSLPSEASGQPKANQSNLTRAQVVTLYNTLYVPGSSATMGWTGVGTPTCTPGTTNASFRQAVLDRMNFFRQVAGLPTITFFTSADTIGINSQSSALMQGSNSWTAVNPHAPPASWTCYTSGVATAAGKSNLGKGVSGPSVITAYIDDNGTTNNVVGHRRWILYPPLAKSFSGDVQTTAGSPSVTSANDLWVIADGADGTWGSRPSMPNGVAWPPGGFVPYQVLPSASNRWSFSYPNADMSAAAVTVTKNGQPVAILAYDTRDNAGYGDATVAFRPNNNSGSGTAVSYASPGAVDQPYVITVSGMTGSGVPSSVTYTVTVIDPSINPNATITGLITNGAGVSGVQFCANPSAGVSCNTSDGSGAYSCTVPSGWTGTLHSPIVSGNRIPAQVFSTAVTGPTTRNVTAKTSASLPCNLDIDNNGLLEPAIDGVAMLRRMYGFGQNMMTGLSGTCAQNTSASALFSAANPANFNVTGGASVLPATDGLTLLRVMQGSAGASVTNGIGLSSESGATRTLWGTGSDGQIRAWLNSTCGTDL